MKKYLTIIICLICVALLCSCKKEQQIDTPVSDGFFASGQFAVGGDAEVVDVNAKSLSLVSEMVDGEPETVLTFKFVTGSSISAATEEEECAVPAYSVYTLSNPSRLVVDIDNLSYWDYRRAFEWDDRLITGLFQNTVFGSPRVSVYFQLSSPVRFFAEANGDTLTIRLKEEEASLSPSYFVTANAYNDYRSGSMSLETDLSPTYANDYSNILMISPALSSEEEAVEYRRSAISLYPAIDENLWRIVELLPGTLPEYDTTLDFLQAYQTPAVRLNDGSERVLPVRVPDGLYLCGLPDGEGFLFSKELRGEDEEGDYQQLYIMRGDGKTGLATTFEFAAIEEAIFSPDGRKLAVLERTGVGTHLYVFDADTFEILNDLSEMGFGGGTSAFIWNSLGNTVYAITGDEEIQLHAFDYSIPDETQRHELIDRNSIDEGSLGFADGELYFTMATMEEGSMIFRIKPEGGVRKPFMKGGRFSISGDQRFMAIAETSETSTTSGAGNSFSLYNFAERKSSVITNDFYPYDFLWSDDCTRLYYIESRISGGQNESETSDVEEEEEEEEEDTQAESDPYPYTLWVYDVETGETQMLMDLCAPDVFASGVNTALYLNRAGDDAANKIRASYLLDIMRVLEDDSDKITMAE